MYSSLRGRFAVVQELLLLVLPELADGDFDLLDDVAVAFEDALFKFPGLVLPVGSQAGIDYVFNLHNPSAQVFFELLKQILHAFLVSLNNHQD